MTRILVVEDDAAILRGLHDNLVYEDYEVETARTGDEALRLIRELQPDLVILDIMLPGINGFEVCRRTRSEGHHVPVLMLTARGEEVDRVMGLDLGADDYMTKPFSIPELLARVRAILRCARPEAALPERLEFDDVILDFVQYQARKGREEVHLSPKEFGVLRYLAAHEGGAVTRVELLHAVWGYKRFPTTRTVDNHIAALRSKLEDDPGQPKRIMTVHGVGYRLEMSPLMMTKSVQRPATSMTHRSAMRHIFGGEVELHTLGGVMRYVSAILIMSALAIALPPAAPALAQQGQDLYQQALRKENVEGDLRAAIELYQRIAREFAEDRALVARALVHMGLSYEKLGEPEAQAVYQRVLRDYADQRDAAQQAQARISAADSNVQQDGLVARRVWDGPDVDLFGAISSDGQLLTYVDWSTGDLAIRDLTTGETRRLTNTGYPQYAWFSILSPDGTHVAYEWSGATAPGESRWELRIIGVDGSEPRVLYLNPGGAIVEPKAWSPDGGHILAVSVREDRTAQIVLISVADGSVRVLKSLDWRWPRGMSLSPDGRFLVYSVPPLGDAPQNFDTGQGGVERDLFLLATDGSREIPLVEHPADDSAPVWTPDGKRVLFTSDRTGEPAMWAVDVADGTPTGSARIVRGDMGSPLGVTASGAYYFGRRIEQQHIYTAAFDPAIGRLTASPRKLSQRVEEVSRVPSWSPDGRSLAYHTGGIFDPGVVVVRSRDTGAERRFEHGLGMVRMQWFPDGRSLLLMGSDGQFRPGIYRLDVESGATTLLFRVPQEDLSPSDVLKAAPAVSPDGTTIFHTRQVSASGSLSTRLLAYDLTTGEDREIHHTEAPVLINGFAVSADGHQVAFSTVGGTPEWGTSSAIHSASLHVVPVGGGEVRHLLTMPGDTPYVTPIAWTPDGRGLFFAEPLPLLEGGRHIGLWRIPLDGGEPTRIDLQVDGQVSDPSVHPDGREIAFIGRETTQEVWVVENLLADLERQE